MTTNAPSAPASVGVAHPAYIALKMIATTAKMGMVGGRVLSRSPSGGDAMGRPISGRAVHCPMMRAA